MGSGWMAPLLGYPRTEYAVLIAEKGNTFLSSASSQQEQQTIARPSAIRISSAIPEARKQVFRPPGTATSPKLVVKHVIPDTHWDSDNRFFFPSNGFRAGVFAISVKIQLPGVAVPHPVILALNQFDYSAHLFDGAHVGPGFSDWFLENGASPTIPLWSAFRSRIYSNKQNARERPPDTILIEQSTKRFNVKANVSCPWHSYCKDSDLLAVRAQLGSPDDYDPVVISLSINELSPCRDESLSGKED
ncbi:hypothetical protein QBC37DRAFT_404761 [Rhypophila decipiens]|uniref:Uncharacterized protein n=1 Tax=Rhypophila decipiens TaxID=261697 RepID=A0AAN6Y0A0_9PEZI|nr:hypothetical protein QBC37DRAFT_404761 [Rhypophila decipiens]